jgi:hypothetical protein
MKIDHIVLSRVSPDALRHGKTELQIPEAGGPTGRRQKIVEKPRVNLMPELLELFCVAENNTSRTRLLTSHHGSGNQKFQRQRAFLERLKYEIHCCPAGFMA